jgi:pyruvate ferredoxin oxidoreductase alpha subunit
MLTSAEFGTLPPFSFFDLDTGLVKAELARMRATRRSGPTAENMLRDLSVTAPGAQG